ncbi:MAG: Hsp20/alpha crystallin family protein [Clostridia bacterium]|nr:Hsp20/alpha crystallin family protein [Clostridia bacterium]
MFDLVPFRKSGNDIFSFFSEMEKNFMQNFGGQLSSFKTDIVDKGDKFILEADIPGANKEDINIHVEDNKLTITAKHNVGKETNKDDYIRRERRYGSVQRSFDVSNIKVEKIKADYKNGVLTLDLPKKDEDAPKIKKIDIH